MVDEGDPMNFPGWPCTGVDPTGEFGENNMLGFVMGNIVNITANSGVISGREMVTLIRDPWNCYDENAIKVFNRRDLQVGFVDKRVSDVLAPLLDSSLVSIEGIVPNSRGIMRGKGSSLKIPFQIHVFARCVSNVDEVYVRITTNGLELLKPDEVSVGLSEEIVRQSNADDGKRLNDIFKVESEGGLVEVMEAPKEFIKSELFLHQKEGLAWLVKREDSGNLAPFWVKQDDGVFYNEIMGIESKESPGPLCGGIFADDMGMGKTLTLLSLIALDKCGYVNDLLVDGGSNSGSDVVDDGEEEFVVYGGKNPKKGRGTKVVNRIKKKPRGIGNLDNAGNELNLNDRVASRTTLVVCPPSVFSTWITQLGQHTKPGKLNVYLYYGDRTDDPMELTKYDLVLTTYTTLASELPLETAVFRVAWWRVILDEAHMIKNTNAHHTQAVYKLTTTRRWLVTGTPVQNGLFDLFSFMLFLKYFPFSNRLYWNDLVQHPVDSDSKSGLTRLQAIMAAICLRRTKDKGLLGLPPKIMEICYVDLSAEERELYERMEVEAKTVVRDYISANRVTSNYTAVLSIILRLRQICTHVDLCPKDLIASYPASNIEDVSNNPELLQKMVAMLEDGEDLDCPICISTPTNIVITLCAHIYCKSCILKTLKRGKPRCPLCRHDLSESDLFSPPRKVSDDAEVVSSSKSSKISALLKLLSASRDQDPTAKSVIFSQFRKMLILLEEPLKNAGFKVLRLDGSMNAKKRSIVIKDFGVPAPDGPTVLLASLKASGTGVNLAAANRVYLLEPWWNPAVEEQAMDRVHRIGQTKEVTIVKIIARNSIEERILELQDKKKRMASEAFDKKSGPTERREINIDDIRTLISLTG